MTIYAQHFPYGASSLRVPKLIQIIKGSPNAKP